MAFRRKGQNPQKSRRPKRVTKKGVKAAVRKYKDKVFNNRVKNAMDGLMEVKNSGIRGDLDVVPFTGANWVTIDANNVIGLNDFVINQGTGESGRVGNVIAVKSCRMRYLLHLLPQAQAGTSVPSFVRLIFFYDKADPNSLPTPYTNANFIDNGNSSQNFTGDVTDLFYRYNTDRYRIFGVRTHKIGWSVNSQNTNTTTIQSQFYSNNDSKLTATASVDLTKWTIKKQRFNDNLGTSYSRGLYCIVQSIYQDGRVAPTATPLVKMVYEIDLRYTDA